MSGRPLRFSEFELDLEARRLSRAGASVPLQPKVYDLLVHLIENRQKVIHKRDLLEALWAGEALVPAVLTTAMGALRKALGDDARAQRFVRTVPSVGYHFVAEVSQGRAVGSRDVPAVAMARHASFVGRRRELEIFDAILDDPASTTRLLYVHGPGGIGKTSVLQEWVHRCELAGVETVQLDAEHISARPRAFEEALGSALGVGFEALRDAPPRLVVVFIDNFDVLASLARWFRESLWPRMPDGVRFVLAARSAPDARWRVDSGWVEAGVEVALPPFDEAEARRFLRGRGIAVDDIEPLVEFTAGHPLALAIAAEAVERGADPRALPTHREVIDALTETFTDRTPSPLHRRALEAASLLSSFNQRLLAELVGVDGADDLYDWLSRVSFVRPARSGLQMHQLVREAVLGQLRWRDPQRLGQLAAHCYELHFDLLARTSDEAERMAITVRIMSLGRHNPALRPYYADDDVEFAIEPGGRPSDHIAVREMVRRFEGDEAATILDRWLASGFAALTLVRDRLDVAAGFTLALQLPASRIPDFDWDPAMAVIARHLQQREDCTDGDSILVYRWLVSRDGYQDVSAILQRCHEVLNHDLHTMSAAIAYSFNVYGEPETWAVVNGLADHGAVAERFVLGRREYGMYAHSWRAAPLHVWVRSIVAKLSAATR